MEYMYNSRSDHIQDNDCKSLRIKTDELSMDRQLHEQQCCITVRQARFVAVMIPGEPEAKQDQTGALVSNDLCKFGHEISGIQGLRPEHLDRAEIIPRVTQMSAAREEHRQPRMLVTSAAAARSEGRKASWKILAWILSSNSHADQPGERNLEVRSRR